VLYYYWRCVDRNDVMTPQIASRPRVASWSVGTSFMRRRQQAAKSGAGYIRVASEAFMTADGFKLSYIPE
jgi:hypothetical protein